MRTIKFRGKRIDDGEWMYGSLVDNLWFKADDKSPIPQIIAPTDNYSCWDDLNEDGEGIYDVNPATVGQFTGLIDKNGKEIYEGDVVNVPNFIQLWDEQSDDLTGEIKYLDGAFHINSEEPHFGEVPLLGIYTNEKTTSDIEVIGNVHDNPELI